ncbi:MAG: glycosyl transferase group 1 [uncultured bacterium]|nr:MAG: glycosyl transferase group 1 [uncultured bacterium]
MKKRLSIAMVAPPFGDTGGPEVAVLNLAEALEKAGAEVTLFAPGDWHTSVKHVATLPKSIWNMKKEEKLEIDSLRMQSQMLVVEQSDNFDIVHFHCQRFSHFAAEKIKKPTVLTMHNNFSDEMLEEMKKSGMKIVALSDAQARGRDVDAIIGHGLPMKNIKPSYEKGKYLLFLGRIAEQKGVDTAIEIAKKTGKKLYIIGRIGNTKERKKYFTENVESFVDEKQIFYLGTVEHEKIYEYCAGAEALLFPIKRPESFGLVSLEALACGTPVIGTKVAPLPEILRNEKVAFLSDKTEELIDAVKNIDRFDRHACRKYAEDNFDSLVMAMKYLELYEKILKNI